MLMFMSMIDEPSDKEKFIEIYERYDRLMLYVANQLVKDSYEAEDIVQEAFFVIAKHISKISAPCTRTKNLCVTIVRNKCIDRMRKEKGMIIPFEDVTEKVKDNVKEPLDCCIEAEQKDLVKEALRALGQEDQLILSLKYYHELDTTEIADILEINANAVGVRLFRAKKRLRRLLESSTEGVV